MTHASLFSGIGGPEVAAAMMGWTNAFHCEINPFGRSVLEYWFPDSVSYDDITKTDFKEWRGRIDVLTGGFPCQPFSYAGKRGGREDERYLWPEMLRAIDEIRPTWVVGENVAGLATMVEDWVLTELGCSPSLFQEGKSVHDYLLEQTYTIEKIAEGLEGLGYSVQPVLIPAAAVGAPHRRDRIFILAHNDAENPIGLRCGIGKNEEQGDKRDVWNACSRNCKWPCTETRIDFADTDGRGGGEIPAPVHAGLADGNEPLRDGGKRNASFAKDLLRNGSGLEYSGAGRAESLQQSGDSGCEDAAYSNGEGLQESQQPGRGENCEEEGAGLDDRTIRPRGHEDVADSYRARLSAALQSGLYGTQERDGAGRPVVQPADDAWIKGTWWDNFPTVSPVHAGNDGLPFRLDGISLPASMWPKSFRRGDIDKFFFGKWRTESLKAYGNSIVPMVMYRIFQSIEEVEK